MIEALITVRGRLAGEISIPRWRGTSSSGAATAEAFRPTSLFGDVEDRRRAISERLLVAARGHRRRVRRVLVPHAPSRRHRLQLALGQAARMSLPERGIRGDVRQNGGWFPMWSKGRIQLEPVVGFTLRIALPPR